MPWNKFKQKIAETFDISFRTVDDLYFNVEKKIVFGEATELADSEAVDYLKSLHCMDGELYVITDYCYETNCGPFIMDSGELPDFVNAYYVNYGDSFYSTDIVIVNFEEKLIWVLFHEGICWLSRG